MEKKQANHKHTRDISGDNTGPHPSANGKETSTFNLEQLQRLVKLMDRSDVTEVELNRAEEGMRLVLRKAQASAATEEQIIASASETIAVEAALQAEEVKKHRIVSPLVGIFHTWAKPKGGTLVAVGDRVKVGQLVATIESLNVINEVESTVSGQVSEILVQEGQPVEYGQPLMVIELTGEE